MTLFSAGLLGLEQNQGREEAARAAAGAALGEARAVCCKQNIAFKSNFCRVLLLVACFLEETLCHLSVAVLIAI